MIRKSRLLQSFVLIVSFSGVLVLMFMPLFDGQTPLQFADSLYNSISKGSAYFIPAMKKTAARYDNTAVSANLVFGDEDQARQVARLFEASGAQAAVNGRELKVNGNLGRILASSLEDCDAMYHNEEARVQSKYGYDARAALYNWWAAFHELQRELKTQNHFQQAKTVSQVVAIPRTSRRSEACSTRPSAAGRRTSSSSASSPSRSPPARCSRSRR